MSFFSSLFSFSQSDFEKIKKYILKSSSEIEESDKSELIKLIKPTIGIKTESKNDQDIAIGTSKIGGKPDLPKDFKWPIFDNEPLTFCAQYNLSELAKFDVENRLPNKGIFYVFVYIDKDWPGFMNKESSYKLIYIENIDDIERSDFPKEYFDEGKFKVAKIKYFEYFTIPDDENYKLKEYQNKYTDFGYFHETLMDYIDSLSNQKTDNFHQILGEDRSIQYSVVFDFAAKKLNVKTSDDYKSKKMEIDKVSRKFDILLQLDCNDENTDLDRFGGNAVMYFGIEPKHLKNEKFGKVVMAFQGT